MKILIEPSKKIMIILYNNCYVILGDDTLILIIFLLTVYLILL